MSHSHTHSSSLIPSKIISTASILQPIKKEKLVVGYRTIATVDVAAVVVGGM
ncbi:uncharacterized protein G2W53_026100 [Senna tora]|uniref:Uncharacterized protein n=1 Tax=Senna tora TaxID=362788 RepID=A0A834TGW6_9FABA|nr:uncharacterized protein G2W53_026100 [Senna tora]